MSNWVGKNPRFAPASINSLGLIPKNNEVESIIASSAINEALEKNTGDKELEIINLEKQKQDLTDIHTKENHELQEKNELLMNQSRACKLTLISSTTMLILNFIRVLDAMIHLKFYVIFTNSLTYWGNSKKDIFLEENSTKRGRPRALSAEAELFLVLIKLECNFLIKDLAIRFEMSSNNMNLILITCYDFVYIYLRSIPIWPSKQTFLDMIAFKNYIQKPEL